MSKSKPYYTIEDVQRMLAEAWASGYWHGTSHEGPLNDAAVDAKNLYTPNHNEVKETK
jgi:hypothetical protein